MTEYVKHSGGKGRSIRTWDDLGGVLIVRVVCDLCGNRTIATVRIVDGTPVFGCRQATWGRDSERDFLVTRDAVEQLATGKNERKAWCPTHGYVEVSSVELQAKVAAYSSARTKRLLTSA